MMAPRKKDEVTQDQQDPTPAETANAVAEDVIATVEAAKENAEPSAEEKAAASAIDTEVEGTPKPEGETEDTTEPTAPVVEEEKPKSRHELIAEAVRPLLNKKEGGSYRVSVKGGIDVYLDLLEHPEFKPLWEEKVTQGKTGEDMEKALTELLAQSRIVLPEVKTKGDEIVKPVKPKGVWLKGLIATALAASRIPEESEEQDEESTEAPAESPEVAA